MTSKFRRLLYKIKGRPHSTVEALSRLMSSTDFRDLLVNCPDRRHIVETAATRIDRREETLISEIAQSLGLKFSTRVGPMDLGALPPGFSLADFRRLGLVGITSGKVMTGVVCVDPATVRPVLTVTPNLPILLSSWLNIARALDESERLHLERVRKEKEAIDAKLSEAAHKVLGVVISESESFGARSVEIRVEDDAMVYEFVTQEGKLCRGTINPKIKAAIFQIFTGAPKGKELSFVMPNDLVKEGISFDLTEPYRRVNLSWKQVALSTIEPIEIQQSDRVIQFPLHEIRDRQSVPELHAPKRVLVVDDNQTFAHVLERFLGRHELLVDICTNAVDALKFLEDGKSRPDLIVSDVHMPGMNGFDFLRALRSSSIYSDIPCVMLTSDEDVETELELLSRGADAFVAKSKDPRLLAVQVKRLIESNGKRAA